MVALPRLKRVGASGAGPGSTLRRVDFGAPASLISASTAAPRVRIPRASRIRPSSFQAAAGISMVAARWPSSVRARRRCPSLMVARWARRVASLVSSSGPRVSKETHDPCVDGRIHLRMVIFFGRAGGLRYSRLVPEPYLLTQTPAAVFSVHPSSASNRTWRLLGCSASSDALSNRCRQSATKYTGHGLSRRSATCAHITSATHVIMQAKFSWLSCYRAIVINNINWFILFLVAQTSGRYWRADCAGFGL